MGTWDDIYKKHGMLSTKPSSHIERLIEFLKNKKSGRILDFGCGGGRHVLHLSEMGFLTVGSDISLVALDIAQKFLEKNKCKNYILVNHDMVKIPFPDCHFNAIISINTIHHNTLENIKETVKEVKRVLKENGIFLATLASTKNSKYEKGKKLEKNTFVMSSGEEKGVPHHFFDSNGVEKIFSEFHIISLEHVHEWDWHWLVLVKKNAT